MLKHIFSELGLVCVFLGTVLAQNQNPVLPEATLYDNPDGVGAYSTLATTTYYPALPDFNNRAFSVCLVGTWLFYDNANFNTGGNAGMEYIFKPTYSCSNFNGLGGAVSSVKFVGSSQDFTRDTLTIYENTYFQGAEEYVFTDLENLNSFGKQASLIVTGKSAWTLYDRPNYQGNKVCVFPPPSNDFTPSFVTNTQELTIPVPHGTIASVRKFCYT